MGSILSEQDIDINKFIDEFFENPIHRLIFARLGQIDGEEIDWEWVRTGRTKET